MISSVAPNLKSIVRNWRLAASLTSVHRFSPDYQHLLQRTCCGVLIGFLGTGTFAGSNVQQKTTAQPLRVKGSFVIAATCRDGIIVASDSRGMLKDRQGRRIAYYDTNQKIFPLGDRIVADTGYASLNDPKISFLSALMSRFAESPAAQVDVEKLPASYFQFAATVLPSAGADSAKLQTLVFAGFVRKKPQLCIYEGQSTQTVSCTFSGYVSSPKQQIPGLKAVSSLSFGEAAAVMRKTIDDYASAVQPGLVGGPVVFRTITRTRSEWFGEHPEWPLWTSFTDLARDYGEGRVAFHLMPGVAKSELDNLVGEGSAWARAGQLPSADAVAGTGPVIGSARSGQ